MPFDVTQTAYTSFRDILAERSNPIIAWVGAGLSVDGGLPTWKGLRDELINELRKEAIQETDYDSRIEHLRIVDELNVESNYWNAFSLLREKLGQATYSSTIRHALSGSDSNDVPTSYKQLWDLNISGMINLNIDRFARRAFSDTFPGYAFSEFSSNDVGQSTHLLKSTVKWIAHLHGTLDNKESWVFTSSDLKKLFKRSAYQTFINTCLTSRTVLFIGISADDIAAGGHLEQLTHSGLDCGDHFWITHLKDRNTREWAEQAGIRIIYYDAKNNDHSELDHFFKDLKNFIPSERENFPVVIQESKRDNIDQYGEIELPSPQDLRQKSSQEIRILLNKKAAELLHDSTQVSYERYKDFAEEYSESIYRAWYVTTKENENMILGYKLTDKIAKGAFGTVYKAEDEDGNVFALKVLHENIREDYERLQSFRRGIFSMKILTNNRISGIVNYHDASEIPAMVVMDIIEGINLTEATKQGVLDDWSDLLKIATSLTKIIRSSHQLPQRVLHRDIRPSNIMLENCWGPYPEWEDVKVKVLDFDLSWHIDAHDVSITQPGTSNGFLAPEQINRDSGITTRNAAVDSYGLGMTLYYLRTKVEPQVSEHRHVDWKKNLEGCAQNWKFKQWISLPTRYFRLIYNATRDLQEDRLDMSQIQGELDRLYDCALKPNDVVSSELLAEELAARAFKQDYRWDVNTLTAIIKVGNVTCKLKANESDHKVTFSYQWLKTGEAHSQSIRKWQPKANEKAKSILVKNNWKIIETNYDPNSIFGRATIETRQLSNKIEDYSNLIRDVFSAISYS